MFVWVFQGNLGQGKTSGMSTFAWYFKTLAERMGSEVTLFSNYGLLGAHDLVNYKSFLEVAAQKNSICLLDEAHNSLDSRLFQRSSNIYATQFFYYLRKIRASLFLASPSINNLDSRIRGLCNILVDVHKTRGGFVYYIYDYQAGKLINRKFMPFSIATKIFKTGLYDTWKILTSVIFPKNERQFKEFLESLIKVNEMTLGNGGHSNIDLMKNMLSVVEDGKDEFEVS